MPAKDMENDEDAELREEAEAWEEDPERVERDCEELEKLLAEKGEELKLAQDRVLRLAAELDNTRKRLEREKAEAISYANDSLMRELLPVIDNLERAIEHGEKEGECKGLLEGVGMTLKSFLDVYSKFGGKQFDSVGEPFDPNRHEAVTQEVTSEYPNMTVLREFQKGYTLRDRLLRPAMVGVAKNSQSE